MTPIPYNYKWYHGGIMNACHTDLYNDMSAEIERNKRHGTNKGWVERLKNSRHLLVEFYNPSL